MTLAVTRSLLLAASLLLTGLFSCSKKDEVAPLPVPSLAPGTGTYTMDGVVTATVSSCYNARGYDDNRNPVDELFVSHSSFVNNQLRRLALRFIKPLNADRSNYQLQSIDYRDGTVSSPLQRTYALALRYTLVPTSDGYVGAFEARDDAANNYLKSTITAGAFNVKL